jgi:hypothetical protein
VGKFRLYCYECGDEKIVEIPQANSKSIARRLVIQLEDEKLFEHKCGKWVVGELLSGNGTSSKDS